MIRKLWGIAGIFLLMTSGLSAETLRGSVRGEAVPDGAAVVFGLDDLVQVSLPTATKFTKALEVEVTIPRESFPYRSSLAVFVYQKFVPPKGSTAATGERVAIEVLPPAAKFYLQAPLVPKAGLKAAVDVAILKLPLLEAAFPLAVTVLPIDKELPPGYEKFQFSLRTRLVNNNLGGLVIQTPTLSEEDRRRLKITANGQLQPSEGPLLLEPGPYTLEVALPGGDSVQVNAVVTQAKTTEVTVELAQDEPSVVIEAPEGTQVTIDGKRILWKPQTAFPMERGPHTVQFVVGNTVVSDTFLVEKSGRHRLSLKFSVGFSRD